MLIGSQSLERPWRFCGSAKGWLLLALGWLAGWLVGCGASTNDQKRSIPSETNQSVNSTVSLGAAGSLGSTGSLGSAVSSGSTASSVSTRGVELSLSEQVNCLQADPEQYTIQLRDTAVKDTDLNALLQAHGLTDLLLDAGVVTDRGMETLGKLAGLEHLRLRESVITDEGLRLFCKGQSKALRVLNLPQAKISSSGIRQLANMPALVQLRLGGAALDDAAIQAIATLPALRSLHLIGPAITDEGLLALADSPRLASLYIDDCELSGAAWEQLFAEKPGLHVHVDQSHHDRDPNKHAHP